MADGADTPTLGPKEARRREAVARMHENRAAIWDSLAADARDRMSRFEALATAARADATRVRRG